MIQKQLPRKNIIPRSFMNALDLNIKWELFEVCKSELVSKKK